MPLPGDLNTITVTGQFLDGAGNPQSGVVMFTPSAELTDQTGKVILAQVPITATVSSSTGSFSQAGLACTDNANITPSSWAWVVTVAVAGASQTFNTYLPHGLGTTVDISALAPYISTTVPAVPLTGTITPGTAAGGDLSGTYPSPQVWRTHLSSPLPVAQGGTGVATTAALLSSINGVPLTAQGQQQLATQRSLAMTPWMAGLANRQYAPCVVACLGDSITEGQHAVLPPNGYSNRWVTRLGDLLRARYPVPLLGTTGRGYMNYTTTGETSFQWPTTIAGSPPSTVQGPKAQGVQLNTTGQSVTFSLIGDSADIMWVQVPAGGSFSWAVDGGSPTTISTAGASTVDGKLTRVSLGVPGPHALTLAWVSGNADINGVVEYYGDSAAGIRVHDCGHFGWTTGQWVTALNGGVASGPSAAIAALAPSAVVIMLGVNDQFANVAPATFQTNLQTIIANLKSQLTTPYPAFVLAMLPPRTGQNGYTFPWSQYVAAAYAVAAADTSGYTGASGVTVMDFTLGPRIPGADTDVFGIWQAGDLVHPSDKGHQAIADAMSRFLTLE